MFRMRTAALALAAGTTAVGAAACSASDWEYVPASGTIIYMEYEAPEWEQECGYDYEYDPISGKYKNVYDCDTYYESECWLVEFETPEGDVVEDCTRKEMWQQLEVGAVYTEGQKDLATHTPWLTPSPTSSSST